MENENKRPLCKQPRIKERKFKANVSSERSSFILSNDKKWVNGTEIKYFFLGGPEAQKKVVRKSFQYWKSLGIGLLFVEVSNRAESILRIAFDSTDGSWSYVGRDNLTIQKNRSTMNFGWDLTTPYGITTALHEIGHAIGFQHEHQSPFSGIEWNAPAVYREFSGPPNNWSKPEIDSNILEKLPANLLNGSAWDPKSIMEYGFNAGLILQPVRYQNGISEPEGLSKTDISGVRKLYPPLAPKKFTALKVGKQALVKAKAGGQSDFIFKAPITATYTFQTLGEMDSVMVINEKGKNENHYLGGDDDSGLDQNAKLSLPLVKGREYLINVRVMFAGQQPSGSITVSN